MHWRESMENYNDEMEEKRSQLLREINRACKDGDIEKMDELFNLYYETYFMEEEK